VASDVIYADSFATPAEDVMESQDVTGIDVPDSRFVTNQELASPASWKLIVERLTRPPAAGGLRGNGIVGVRALPAGDELSRTDENTVQASDRLAFEVLVENSGQSQETQVKVNLTIQQSPEPIREEATIDAINPGDTKSVVFRSLDQVSFGPRTILKVTVEPVPGEENTNNNTAEYVVIFTFG
jgi:CARDB